MSICGKRARRSPRQFQNCIFTIITCQKRPSQKTQTSLKKDSPSLRQRSMSPTRSTHILNIRACMNNHSCTQKKQCFKTCVCHLMIHCLTIMTQGECNHHISQLTTGTICNDTFDIILNLSHTSSHQTCNRTNTLQNISRKYATFPKRICTSNQKNTSSNQSCSMNQCRNWSRSFHSISKPYMEPNLCTFSQGTSQKSKTNPISIICRSSQCNDLRSISTSQIPPTKKQPNKQNSITHTIHLHCFLCSFCSALAMKPESNQKITAHTNHFPSYLKCNQVICSHLQQHRTCKETQITQKTRQMWISLHVPQTINMNTKTHKCNSYHYGSTQSVKRQKPIDRYCMYSKPRRQRNKNRRALNKDFIKNKKAQKGTCSQALNCNTSSTTCSKPTTYQACKGTSQKWSKKSTHIHF